MQIDSMMWDIGLQDAAGYGQMCERIGYDCVWTYEAAHNPFMPLAQVAAATENIHIGTNIAVAFARSPYAMAQAAWDLADVSKGRFHLGIGSQVRPMWSGGSQPSLTTLPHASRTISNA